MLPRVLHLSEKYLSDKLFVNIFHQFPKISSAPNSTSFYVKKRFVNFLCFLSVFCFNFRNNPFLMKLAGRTPKNNMFPIFFFFFSFTVCVFSFSLSFFNFVANFFPLIIESLRHCTGTGLYRIMVVIRKGKYSH